MEPSLTFLEQILAARDRRAAFQRQLLVEHGLPVLSLTLVSPGPVKDSLGRRRLMDMAEKACSDELCASGLPIRQRLRTDAITGPEALWAVEALPEPLKRLAIKIEETRPWGRLLDADVILPDASLAPSPLGRQALEGEPRPCIVCGREAKACIGLRRHHPAAAAAMVAALVGRFTGQP